MRNKNKRIQKIMISNTKVLLDEKAVAKLCAAAGFRDIENVTSMGAGEFNAVYAFDADEKGYALKIAPDANVPVMTYETNMMQSEVYWYEKLRTHTDIRVPEIVYTDFSKSLVLSDFFIMERINGRQMNEMNFTPQERADATSKLPQMAAQIHRIRHDGYGYLQNGYHATWDQALAAMTEAIICDAGRMGESCENGEKVLKLIHKHRAVLAKAPCRMVNFDLWEANILCERMGDGSIQYVWIDPERSYWGDPIMDIICFEPDRPLMEKKASIGAYNQVAEQPIGIGREEEIRFAFAQAYLGLIMEVERYYRYVPGGEGWQRNVFACQGLFAGAYGGLE